MAQVFLSYDREDGAKARVIAQALERAGHFVWFDLHIKGGAEYGKVIEEALDAADAVVVLWSTQSVQSAWVRDEAAAGRDKNCLIPILIEPVSPPMGFRQYQNLDFSSWKGRGKPPHLADLLSSIEALAGPPADALSTQKTSASPSPPPQRRLPRWLIVSGLATLALVAVGLFVGLVLNGPRQSAVQTVAVTAVDPAARPLARDLLVKLSTLQGAKSGSMRLLGQDGGSTDADLIFEAASSADDKQVGASLVLMAGEQREILWSKDFEQPSGKSADLKQQIALTAARVLGCALQGLTDDKSPLDERTLKLYLNACAQLEEQGDTRLLSQAFLQITERAPRFAPAWSGLLLAQMEAASFANMGDASDPASLNAVRKSIERVRKLHPDLPEARIAQSQLLPANAFLERIRLLDEAKAASPDNPVVLSYRSSALRSAGRMYESIEDARHAVDVDPLSPAAFNSYISALAYAGRIEAAREQLANAERLWPGTGSLRDIQYRFHLRFGDPKEALRLGQSFDLGKWGELFLEARAEPTKANIQALKQYLIPRTGDDVGVLSFTAQALGLFNLNDELYQLVLPWRSGEELAEVGDIWFRPALDGFRRDPRFMLVARKIGLLDYWRKSGNWPDFCRDPDLPYDCKAEAAKLTARPGA